MRMRNLPAAGLALLIGLATVGCTTSATSSPPTALQMQNLLETSLADELAPGREVIISVVEIPPYTTMERHWHPGEEFQYYLEGDAEVTVEGEPPIHAVPGAVGHVPYRKWHTARTGAQGAKAVVFRVHEAGQPVRHLESGGSADH